LMFSEGDESCLRCCFKKIDESMVKKERNQMIEG